MKEWEQQAILLHTERLLGLVADVVMPTDKLALIMQEISVIRMFVTERSFDDLETTDDRF